MPDVLLAKLFRSFFNIIFTRNKEFDFMLITGYYFKITFYSYSSNFSSGCNY